MSCAGSTRCLGFERNSAQKGSPRKKCGTTQTATSQGLNLSQCETTTQPSSTTSESVQTRNVRKCNSVTRDQNEPMSQPAKSAVCELPGRPGALALSEIPDKNVQPTQRFCPRFGTKSTSLTCICPISGKTCGKLQPMLQGIKMMRCTNVQDCQKWQSSWLG